MVVEESPNPAHRVLTSRSRDRADVDHTGAYAPTLGDIAEGLANLAIAASDGAQTSVDRSSTDRAAAAAELSSSSPRPRIAKQERSLEKAREDHVATHRAQDAFAILESDARDLHSSLADTSNDNLAKAEAEMAKLWKAWKGITHQTPSLNNRRSEVKKVLDQCSAHLAELRLKHPSKPSSRPVVYDCGKFGYICSTSCELIISP